MKTSALGRGVVETGQRGRVTRQVGLAGVPAGPALSAWPLGSSVALEGHSRASAGDGTRHQADISCTGHANQREHRHAAAGQHIQRHAASRVLGLALPMWCAFRACRGPFARRRWGFGSRAVSAA